MFFTKFNPMTAEEVNAKVEAGRKAAGESCSCLAGKSFKAMLEGEHAPEQLDYKFLDPDTLEFTENGETFTAPYTAVSYGKIVLFTHLVPGTSRGWHVVRHDAGGTAFETGSASPCLWAWTCSVETPSTTVTSQRYGVNTSWVGPISAAAGSPRSYRLTSWKARPPLGFLHRL